MASAAASTSVGKTDKVQHKFTNRLASEESPYLLQHAHNPVDWYPWGEEAFRKAKEEDKPIFLSVGYSTCHWCHVMERESFENEAIAKLMNENFVNIKVDKEERSDVDRVYMTYVQATQGGGGWPMSVFLTPDLQPFLGGTYFPPMDAYGRPGFATMLKRITEVWRTRKNELKEQSADTMQQLSEATQPQAADGEQGLESSEAAQCIERCYAMLASRFDSRLGGFGGAPKFPRPAEINLLLVEHLRSEDDRAASSAGSSTSGRRKDALSMAEYTLQKMAAGGMYDHIGGGFHRYSVDEYWHVPHFEKMLYDNGQLAQSYLDAYRITGDARYSRVARGILDYLHRHMTHPGGGIFSAEDADSLDTAGKKSEGAFYVWTADEIDEVLGTDSERARVFKRHYYVKPQGNCDLSPRSDPHEEFAGKNCLIERESIEETASAFGLSVEETEKTLARARELLHERRMQRPRPHLDDKVVTAWNGLAIGAFANAARVLSNEQQPEKLFPMEGRPAKDYLADATMAAEFVRDNLWDEQRQRLRRSYRTGPSDVEGFADDYANLISGLLDLHAASGDTQWLKLSIKLQAVQDELFWDDTAGGYFATAGTDASILLRMKEDYDGAEPAASSIAVGNLLRLSALAGPERAQQLRERAARAAGAFRERLSEMALAMPQMCCSLHLLDSGHFRQVIITGKSGAADTEMLLDAAQAPFAPDKAIIFIDMVQQASQDFWRSHNPEALAMVEGAGLQGDAPATAFVCQNFTCKAPTTDPQKLKAALSEARTTPSAKPVLGQVDISKLGKK